jgi:acetyltransferase-like isoleucine patch superfamily enzyme
MSTKKIFLILVSLLPFWPLRRMLYRFMLGIHFGKNSYIGMFTLFNAVKGSINGTISSFNFVNVGTIVIESSASIGKFNRINKVNTFTLESNAVILHRNLIAGVYDLESEQISTKSNFYLGHSSQVSSSFIVDLVDQICIGNNTVLGGYHTQLWTHAFDGGRQRYDGPINIGDRCFIGSNVIITHGTTIGSDIVLAAGSVAYKDLLDSGSYSTSRMSKIK